MQSVTKLPIIFKRILTAEDARLAVQHGVDGIIVSCHGGRQLDTVPASVSITKYYSMIAMPAKSAGTVEGFVLVSYRRPSDYFLKDFTITYM